ncbi:MAG: hypothetical protein ACLPYZ_09225 [Limisphaerales bacterium]
MRERRVNLQIQLDLHGGIPKPNRAINVFPLFSKEWRVFFSSATVVSGLWPGQINVSAGAHD